MSVTPLSATPTTTTTTNAATSRGRQRYDVLMCAAYTSWMATMMACLAAIIGGSLLALGSYNAIDTTVTRTEQTTLAVCICLAIFGGCAVITMACHLPLCRRPRLDGYSPPWFFLPCTSTKIHADPLSSVVVIKPIAFGMHLTRTAKTTSPPVTTTSSASTFPSLPVPLCPSPSSVDTAAATAVATESKKNTDVVVSILTLALPNVSPVAASSRLRYAIPSSTDSNEMGGGGSGHKSDHGDGDDRNEVDDTIVSGTITTTVAVTNTDNNSDVAPAQRMATFESASAVIMSSLSPSLSSAPVLVPEPIGEVKRLRLRQLRIDVDAPEAV